MTWDTCDVWGCHRPVVADDGHCARHADPEVLKE